MRIKILDRILVGLAGLILIAGCAALAAQLFFQQDVVAWVSTLLSREGGKTRIAIIAGGVLLLLLGIYCLTVLFRHRRKKDKFVQQKTENGELSISIKALSTMVEKCLTQHPELSAQSVNLENQRDGLLIRIRGTVAGGISIPLTVEALQKQVKQYVTACSGVEVRDIRVQIESSGEDAKDAPFAIAPPAATPLLKEGEKAEEPIPEKLPEEPAEAPKEDEEPAAEAPAPAPAPAVQMPEMVYDEDDDRPIHQRLFAPKAEPCIVPMPPEEAETVTEENQTDAVAETAETPAEQEIAEPEPAAEKKAAEEKDAAETVKEEIHE